MKLKKISIRAFGRFEKVSWELPADLNVFYGLNEAGKTTIAVFIKQVLFGFPVRQKRFDLFEDYSPLSGANPMGGSLTFADGNDTYVLERLKQDRHADTVTLTLNGEEVPASLFYDKIKNVDGDFYQDSFVFDQDQLARVTELSRQDLLERVYFLGAAQSHRLEEIRGKFEDEAQDLFKPRGKNPALNQLLTQHDESQEHLEELQQEQTAFTAERQRYAELRKQLAEQVQVQKQKEAAFNQDSSLLQKLPAYQQLQELNKIQQDNFDEKNYQQAQALAAQAASFSTQESDLDIAQADAVLAQKLNAVNWLNEQKNTVQKQADLQKDLEQKRALNPQAAKLADMSTAELAQLRKDWPQEKQNSNKFVIIAWLVAVALTIATFAFNKAFAVVFGIAAVGLLLYAFLGNKPKTSDFEQKYGFAPQGSADDLINAVVAMQDLDQQLTACQAKQTELASQLAGLRQQLQLVMPTASGDLLQDLSRLDQLTAAAKANELQKQKQAEVKIQLQKVLAQAGVDSWPAYQDRYQEHLAAVQKKAQAKALADQLGPDLPRLQSIAADEKFKASVEKQKAELAAISEQTEALRQQAADLQAELRHEAGSADVARQSQAVSQLASQAKQTSQQYLADLLASELIQTTLGLASHNSFPKMMTAADKYLALLTGDRYDKLIWPKSGRGVELRRADGQKVPLRNLSRGTAEQLYFALKLAFVQKAAGEVGLPLIIDDAFVNFDPRRRQFMKQLLQTLASERQVLVFTADQDLAAALQPAYLDLNEVKHA